MKRTIYSIILIVVFLISSSISTFADGDGNIDNGDYITSGSNGYGVKQDDDLMHNYTVAKALESVDWSKETTTTKMIACTYHCG